MIKIIISILIVFSCLILSSNLNAVFAQPSSGDFDSWMDVSVPNFAGGNVSEIISELIPYIVGLAGFLLMILLILGGYQVMVSQGDPKKMAQGRERITYAIVGYIILFSSYFIVQIMGRVLDIPKINDLFG